MSRRVLEQFDRLQAEIIRLSRLREEDAARLKQIETVLAHLEIQGIRAVDDARGTALLRFDLVGSVD